MTTVYFTHFHWMGYGGREVIFFKRPGLIYPFFTNFSCSTPPPLPHALVGVSGLEATQKRLLVLRSGHTFVCEDGEAGRSWLMHITTSCGLPWRRVQSG